jgi:hypothetical protein
MELLASPEAAKMTPEEREELMMLAQFQMEAPEEFAAMMEGMDGGDEFDMMPPSIGKKPARAPLPPPAKSNAAVSRNPAKASASVAAAAGSSKIKKPAVTVPPLIAAVKSSDIAAVSALLEVAFGDRQSLYLLFVPWSHVVYWNVGG